MQETPDLYKNVARTSGHNIKANFKHIELYVVGYRGNMVAKKKRVLCPFSLLMSLRPLHLEKGRRE